MNTSSEEFKQLLARSRSQAETERMQIARALHDDVSQQMTVLTIELALLQQRLGADHVEAGKLSELLTLVTEVNKSVRKITNQVRPKILDEFGFVAAMKYECQRLQKDLKIPISFRSSTESISLPPARASELFRLVQVTLSEAVTFAKPGSLAVELSVMKGMLSVRIMAFGACTSERSFSKGDPLSVANLRESALWLEAEFHLESIAESGLAFTITCPIEQNK